MDALEIFWLASIVGLSVVGVGLVVWVRLVSARRLVDRRVDRAMVPAESFEPSADDVKNWAASLSGVRSSGLGRMFFAPGYASSVRFGWRAVGHGQTVTTVSVPPVGKGLLNQSPLADVEFTPFDQVGLEGQSLSERADRWRNRRSAVVDGEDRFVVRAQLTLSSNDAFQLGDNSTVGTNPMAGLVSSLQGVNDDETVELVLSLVPLTKKSKESRFRRVSRLGRGGSKSSGPRLVVAVFAAAAFGAAWLRFGRLGVTALAVAAACGWEQVLEMFGVGGAKEPSPVGVESKVNRKTEEGITGGTVTDEQLFEVAVFVRATSPVKGQAKQHVKDVVTGLEALSGPRNRFRVAGFAGLEWSGRWRADWPVLNWFFDNRMEQGRQSLWGRSRVVTTSSIAAMIVPATSKIDVGDPIRTGVAVAPAPKSLERFTGRADQLPLGWVNRAGGSREIVATKLRDTVHGFCCGASRSGKTYWALQLFLHMARHQSVVLVDPHIDAATLAKSYLSSEPELAKRTIQLDFDAGHMPLGWNPLATAGLSRREIQERGAVVVDGLSVGVGWGQANQRAMTILARSVQALMDINAQLPPDRAATIYQVSDILSPNPEFRDFVVPRIKNRDCREWWVDSFPELGRGETAPVTRVIDKLDLDAIRGVLGQSESSFDFAELIDNKGIVLLNLSSSGYQAKLLAAWVMYDLFGAVVQRRFRPDDAESRPDVALFCDELQGYQDSVATVVQGMLEQLAKYRLRFFGMTQSPHRVSKETLIALLTNTSLQLSGRLPKVAPLDIGGVSSTDLLREPRQSFVGAVQVDGQMSKPIRFQAGTIDEVVGLVEGSESQISDLNRSIAAKGRPLDEVLADQETLKERIVEGLKRANTKGGPKVAQRGKNVVMFPDLEAAGSER